MGRGGEKQKADADPLVPVTLLCGFLGSGKTTLLKHILETKHDEEDFKCAVIVNDMAEINIDKSLIDNTSLLQSDESMVGMQNGCICCTLQDDLCSQIIQLTQKKMFNYIIIEASGVSEPHEIAPLFEIQEELCEGEQVDPDKPQLGEVARLDTCVTMIDSADFHNNLASMKTYDDCTMVGTIAELMIDQVEFANVICLNKCDLVNDKQSADVYEKIQLLNGKAKIMKSVHSKIDVRDIINTLMYKDKEEFIVTSTKQEANIEARAGKDAPEACTARFDIKSFVYRARKPFHPGRLNDLVLEPFFMDPFENIDDEDENGEAAQLSDQEKQTKDEEKKQQMEKTQTEANVKAKARDDLMGDLLRSKGFFWLATSHDVIGGWQQAANVLRIEPQAPWMCLLPEDERKELMNEEIEAVLQEDMKNEAGEFYEYKDRRQEIVFIGHRMKKDNIQELMDKCLLTDEEFALGPEKWKETMDHLDVINLSLGDDEEEEEEVDEDQVDQGEECRKACEKRAQEGDEEAPPCKKPKTTLKKVSII